MKVQIKSCSNGQYTNDQTTWILAHMNGVFQANMFNEHYHVIAENNMKIHVNDCDVIGVPPFELVLDKHFNPNVKTGMNSRPYKINEASHGMLLYRHGPPPLNTVIIMVQYNGHTVELKEFEDPEQLDAFLTILL